MKLKARIRSLAVMLVMAMALTAAVPEVLPQTHTVEAAKKKPALKTRQSVITVKVGKKKTVKVTGNAGKTVKWTASSKNVKLSKKKGTRISVKGVKDGVSVLTAKAGKSKVKVVVFVGKGKFSDASSKTRKAAGNPTALVANYVKKHPISVSTGNTYTYYSEHPDTRVVTYSLKVVGTNLVVSITYEFINNDTRYENDQEVPFTWHEKDDYSMYLPVAGGNTAYVERTYADNYPGNSETSKWRATLSDIAALTAVSRIDYSKTSTNTIDGTQTTDTETYRNKPVSYLEIDDLVDSLNALLVDNNTGYTAKDLGFTSFHPNHSSLGVLTRADLAEYAARNDQIRAYNIAHKDDYDDD